MIETLERLPEVKAPAKPRPKKLTLLRRFWRRSRRYLLMAVMAFTLSFGLVAVPVVKAEADLLSAATIAEINGAMKMPLTQVVVNAIKLHPVGFALGTVASLGLLAYATKDQWWPYVTGDFGAADPDAPAAPLGTSFYPTLKVTDSYVGVSPVLPHQVQIVAAHTGTTTGFAVLAVTADCKRADGTIYRKSGSGSKQLGTTAASRWMGTIVSCDLTTDRVVGWIAGTPSGHELLPARTASGELSYRGPENVKQWGTIAAETGFDPRSEETNYVTSAECIDPAGNISIVEYTSKGADGMLRMPPCAVLAPGTHGTGKLWIDGYAPGSTIPQRLYDVDPMTDPDHPLCSPSRPGSGCTLGVSIDGKPCVIGDVQCESWTEIRRDDQTGARVSCNYGPYLVGVEQCNILERAYQIGGAPATEENIDGNPDTSNWNQPNGDPWKPKPQPEPGTGNNTSTLPTTGTNPGATPGESGQNCLAAGWSWDPVSWVMVPVQCALQWAFVPPKLKVETTLQTLQPRLEARGITPFVAPFMGSLSGLGGSGCTGPAIDLSVIHLPTFYPFSACAEPMSQIASGVSSFFALSLVVQGGMSCIRGVAAAFGFNWGLGSSKTSEGS